MARSNLSTRLRRGRREQFLDAYFYGAPPLSLARKAGTDSGNLRASVRRQLSRILELRESLNSPEAYVTFCLPTERIPNEQAILWRAVQRALLAQGRGNLRGWTLQDLSQNLGRRVGAVDFASVTAYDLRRTRGLSIAEELWAEGGAGRISIPVDVAFENAPLGGMKKIEAAPQVEVEKKEVPSGETVEAAVSF